MGRLPRIPIAFRRTGAVESPRPNPRRVKMAILVMQTLPPEVTLEQVLAVSQELGTRANPPAGGISHAVIVDGGQVKVIDVWESQEALNTFIAERLTPAIMKVA